MGRNLLCFAISIISAGAATLVDAPALAEPSPERNADFGETHVHISWSLDAFAMGNTLTTRWAAGKVGVGTSIA